MKPSGVFSGVDSAPWRALGCDDAGPTVELRIGQADFSDSRQCQNGVMDPPEHDLDEGVGQISERHVDRINADCAREYLTGESEADLS